MKLRSWLLVVLCAIGMCCGWWGHSTIGASPQTMFLPLAISAVNENLPQQIASNIAANYRFSDGAATRTNGEWIGRLILPSQAAVERSNLVDWVWVEIAHAPVANRELINKQLRLTWQPKSQIEADNLQVITDIKFTAETIASQQHGNIHPQRLNHRSGVGMLQSLAGARPTDDVLVRLAGVETIAENGSESPILTIDREPIQITGTRIGLVKILGTDDRYQPDCDRIQPCLNEYFRVRHYTLNSHGFDGQVETIRIPQIPAKPSGLLPSTIRDLARSPAGNQGWYIYGELDRQGLFTVAAIQPRALFTLTPQLEISDRDRKLDYLNRQHWENRSQNRGQISQVKFSGRSVDLDRAERLGARALAIHLFGGIGGTTGDTPGLWQTVTGHFAYGMATVIRSEFTDELEWQVEYNQVYAHNPDGIISGRQDWATYMGHLQRGWLATRPVADVLIWYAPITEDYDFGGIKLSPLTELQRQLAIFSARYRTGDGTGGASVTPATSCVQDANQALYVTIRQLQQQVRSQPQIKAWIAAHPQHPQTQRFRELQSLGAELETTLAPLGIVRQDWQQNAAKLAGIGSSKGFVSSSPLTGLVSWRTMLPRGAQDGIAKIFSQLGATMWFFNTDRVGGFNPDITSIAPTILFGQLPILATTIVRIWAGTVTLPDGWEWLLVGGLGVSYAVVALAIGFRSGFLTLTPSLPKSSSGLWQTIQPWIQLLFMPALVEEIGFRLLLIPHPIETVRSSQILICSIGSLILFIGYHPFNARTFYQLGNPTFMDWRFLTLTGLLGGVCTIAYLATGSIWPSIVIHWLAVGIWLKFLGGDRRLEPSR
jgi:predicted Abi (CAAX) family protease